MAVDAATGFDGRILFVITQQCDGQPRLLQGGAPEVPQVVYVLVPRPGSPPQRRKIHSPAKIYFSFAFVSSSPFPVGCSRGDFVCLRCEGEDFAGMTETATLWGMDSVRFGRALGIGARAAARTLVTAVDAATAPNPSASTGKPASAGTPSADTKAASTGTRLGEQAARTASQARRTSKGVKEGSKRFGQAVWGPFVKLSGVLWLELTGVFFGIFAVFAIGGTWKMFGQWRHPTAVNHDASMHLVGAAAMAVVFGYFCVSSFVRASRRERGH
jgi:hypothetical protein